jgi:hypothetical protein
MAASVAFRWYKKAAFDAPQLNSPQPCAHGAGCAYTVKDKETGEQVAGCCAFVHPGEEGTGRRLFEERSTTNEAGETTVQKACVRLTGKAGFYERRRLRLSWAAWCERQGLSYTANQAAPPARPRPAPGAPRKAPRPNTLTLPEDRDAAVAVLMAKLSELGVDMRVAAAEEAEEGEAEEGEAEEGEAEEGEEGEAVAE